MSQKDFNFVIIDTQKELLLKFAELYNLYNPDFEIGYNTGGYDWPNILKKVELLKIENEFTTKILVRKSKLVSNIYKREIQVVNKDLDEQNKKYEFIGFNFNFRN